jgi:LCP family protein required for cell wall assembly
MSLNPMYMEYVDDDYRRAPVPGPAPVRRRGWRIVGWISIALSVIMVSTSLTAYAAYRKLQGNITQEDLDAQLDKRPAKLNSALNILLLGSDTRAGANARYGRGLQNEAPRADTTILLHLSPGGQQAIGISFPRDLMVPIPSCKRKDGTRTPPQAVGMINSAFTYAGATCTIATIEALTNIKIDHFATVDFAGFKGVVNALGGVEVCLPRDVNDPQAKLFMKRGRHIVKGEQALGYVRSRHGLGDGSDLSRIKRQQQFMGSVANKALSAGVLANPTKLYSLLNAGTKTLTTDKGLNIGVMMQIAQGMQGLTAGKLRFVTVPWGAYSGDANRVALRQPDASQFFDAIRNDKGIEEESQQATAKVPPSQVKVRVYNGTGVQGQARRYADQLAAHGFKIVEVGTAPPADSTKVLFGSGGDAQAAALSGVLTGVKPTPREDGVDIPGIPGVVDLVIGPNMGPVKAKKTAIPKLQGEIRANGNICKAT